MTDIMAEMITDKTMDEIEILAKLHLTDEEKEKSRHDLQQMLDYVDMLNQVDTSDVEPLTHIFPIKTCSVRTLFWRVPRGRAD